MDFLITLISAIWPVLFCGILAISIAHWISVKYIHFSYRITKNTVVSFLCGVFAFLSLSALLFTVFFGIALAIVAPGSEAYVYMFSGVFALPVVGIFALAGIFLFFKELLKTKERFTEPSRPSWLSIGSFSFSVLFFLALSFVSAILLFS